MRRARHDRRTTDSVAAAGLLTLVLSPGATLGATNSDSTPWLDLGTRGHFAEVVSATGVDGPRARIVARHTRATAGAYCRALAVYEGRKRTDQTFLRPCIRAALSTSPQEHVASANCLQRSVTVPWGPTFRYAGQEWAADKWINQRTGEVLPVGSASNHQSVSFSFEMLCPSTAARLRRPLLVHPMKPMEGPSGRRH
jgi:hypothetical protein